MPRAARRPGGRTPRRASPSLGRRRAASGGRSSAGARQHGEVAVGVEGHHVGVDAGRRRTARRVGAALARHDVGVGDDQVRCATTNPLPSWMPAARLALDLHRRRRDAVGAGRVDARRRGGGPDVGRGPERVEDLREAVVADERPQRRRWCRAAAGKTSSTTPGDAPSRGPGAAGQPGHVGQRRQRAARRRRARRATPATAPPTASTCRARARGTADVGAGCRRRGRAPGRGSAPTSEERRRRRAQLGLAGRLVGRPGDRRQERGRRRRRRRPCRSTTTARATKPEPVAADPAADARATSDDEVEERSRRRAAQARSSRAWVRKPGVGHHPVVGPHGLALDVPAALQHLDRLGHAEPGCRSSASRSWRDLGDAAGV